LIDIEKLIISWQNEILKIKGIKRSIFEEIYQEIKAKPIKIITGFRRSGKSFLCKQIAQKAVLKSKIKLNNILYLNFEDIQTLSLQNLEGLQKIWDTFKQKVSSKGQKIIIFDEIQVISNWDKFIRSIYEKESNISLFLTGSNSKLLSSELGSNLAGRFINFSILPFSFKEFLIFKNINPQNKREFEKINLLYSEYFSYGGLPEIFSIFSDSAKKSYHEGIIKKVILDDIVKRFNIRNISLLEELLSYLLANIGNLTFISKLTQKINFIKKTNYLQSTILDYIQYFLNTFALFSVNKFNWKQNRVFETTKKYYSIDLGLIDSFSESLVNIKNQKLENLVFLHLKNKRKKIYFAQDDLNKEINFITKEKFGFNKYQVCLQLTPENQIREFQNLVLINKYLKKGKNYLITEDKNEIIKYKNLEINVINIIDFLLDNY